MMNYSRCSLEGTLGEIKVTGFSKNKTHLLLEDLQNLLSCRNNALVDFICILRCLQVESSPGPMGAFQRPGKMEKAEPLMTSL